MIVCWVRPDNSYYYRFVKGIYCKYEVGYRNQYDHQIILVIKNPYISKIRYTPRQKLKRFLYRLYNKI